MKLANVGGRAALVLADGVADSRGVRRRFGPDPRRSTTMGRVRRVRGRRSTAGTGALVEADLGARCPRPGRCSPSGSTTGATPRSRAWRCRGAGHVHEVPGQPRGPFDDVELRQRHGRLGGRAGRRDRPTRRPRRRGRRVVARRRGHRRPGPLRPRTCSSRPPASSRSASRAAASARWVRGSSRPTSSPTPTTSPSAARSTARWCRRAAPTTSSSACPASSPSSPPCCPCCPATSSSPARPPASASPPPRRGSSQPGNVLEIVDRGHRHHPQPPWSSE